MTPLSRWLAGHLPARAVPWALGATYTLLILVVVLFGGLDPLQENAYVDAELEGW